MASLLFNIFAFVFVGLIVASNAAIVPSEVYWKSVLPNTPMPKTLRDLLHPPEWINNIVGDLENPEKTRATIGESNNQALEQDIGPRKSIQAADHNQKTTDAIGYITFTAPVYFLEKEMAKGTRKNLHYAPSKTPLATFLPRQVSKNLPFSSSEFPHILKYLSIEPSSKEAEAMKDTVKLCEAPGLKGEKKYCATSLEAMIDFSTFTLGGKVNAISTESNSESDELQEYTIVGVKKMGGGGKAVTCHKRSYPYAVFYCHKTIGTDAYVISMTGANGARANAVAVCHTNTRGWDPNYRAFKVLNVKPGTVPVCHFLPRDHVIWVPY